MTQPLWHPDAADVQRCHMQAFLERVRRECDPAVTGWPSLHRFSLEQPDVFWRLVWDDAGIRATTRGDRVTEGWPAMPGTRWFPDARLNFAENLLRNPDDRPAILFADEIGARQTWTRRQLFAEVARMAAGMRTAGVVPGDRVAGYLPNIPQTVIAMLAAASLGAVWSSCSPDFGVPGVLDRFGQIEPKLLFVADACHYAGRRFDCLARVRELVAALPSVEQVVVVPHVDDSPSLAGLERAVAWDDFAMAADDIGFASLPFDHPLYILYSSGTTGAPKCIVHGAGGTLLQHAKELRLHTDLGDGDRMLYFTTCGWMMWNWLVSALAVDAAVVLYDGSPFHPDGSVLWDLVDEFGVTVLGASAKWIAACEKAGLTPRTSHDLDTLRTLLSTGSPLLPASFDYVYRDVKADIQLSSISGGTDIVSCFAPGNPLLPVYRGELQGPGLGMQVEIRNPQGAVVIDETGELTCALPFPSMPVGFWNDPGGHRYHAAYFDTFPGVWSHGDYARMTPRGGLVIEGRSDATLNPGGVRIGTAEIYRRVDTIDEVLESVCVGQEIGDDTRVVLFVRLREGLRLDDDLRRRIRDTIRAQVSPRHVPAVIAQVPDIPRTVSGKITELAVREVIHGRDVGNTTALANPDALAAFRDRAELAG